MDGYVPSDVTEAAQAISRRHAGTGASLPRHETYGDVTPRCLLSGAVVAGLHGQDVVQNLTAVPSCS